MRRVWLISMNEALSLCEEFLVIGHGSLVPGTVGAVLESRTELEVRLQAPALVRMKSVRDGVTNLGSWIDGSLEGSPVGRHDAEMYSRLVVGIGSDAVANADDLGAEALDGFVDGFGDLGLGHESCGEDHCFNLAPQVWMVQIYSRELD